MKLSLLIASSAFIIYFSGCGSSSKTSTKEDANTNTENLSEYEQMVDKVAKESCECLKPLEAIQQKLEKGEIEMADYANKMQSLSKSLQTCTENMSEATIGKDDMKMEVLDKMKTICPKIAGVIVPVQ